MAEGGEEIAVVDDTEGPNSISFPPKSEDVLEYGDFHKLVLQGIMSAGFLDIKGVKRLFVGTCSYLGSRVEIQMRPSWKRIIHNFCAYLCSGLGQDD